MAPTFVSNLFSSLSFPLFSQIGILVCFGAIACKFCSSLRQWKPWADFDPLHLNRRLRHGSPLLPCSLSHDVVVLTSSWTLAGILRRNYRSSCLQSSLRARGRRGRTDEEASRRDFLQPRFLVPGRILLRSWSPVLHDRA